MPMGSEVIMDGIVLSAKAIPAVPACQKSTTGIQAVYSGKQ
jgi:hypothetical protein